MSSSSLLNEYEVMLNVGLGAEALYSFVSGFHKAMGNSEEAVTLWHLATVLPLVYHEVSRRAISKRQLRSGLRSILTRDPSNDIAQNEVIFHLNERIRAMFPRTMRSLNCAVGWGLLGIRNGEIIPTSLKHKSSLSGETREIVKAAEKLGSWAGKLSSFEYLTVLGVEFTQ